MTTDNPPQSRLVRRVTRVVAAIALLFAGALGLAAAQESAPAAANKAMVLKIEGAIGPATSDYLISGIESAESDGAALIVIEMDTPGGLDTSMREMIRAILNSSVPVATFVSPQGARAASAGTYILYASHVAAMSPATNLGAATPVQVGGGGGPPGIGGPPKKEPPQQGDGKKDEARDSGDSGEETAGDAPEEAPKSAMEKKVINDAVAYIRSLADLRGRNADWAEKSVREGVSLSANEALERNVVDHVASGLPDLLRQIDGRKVKVGPTQAELTLKTSDLTTERIEPGWRTQMLAAITNPNIALIFMMIGIYGLIFEFMNPGALYPGTIGAICLLIGLYALAALPVNYAGAGLIVLGIVLMVAEAFSPSFGVLGIGGTIAFVIGAAILIDTEAPGFTITWPVIGGVAASSLGFTLLVAKMFISSRKHRVVSGSEHMIGARARVLDWNDGSGHVFVMGERWNAVGNGPLSQGQNVRIIGRDGLILTVAPDDAATN